LACNLVLLFVVACASDCPASMSSGPSSSSTYFSNAPISTVASASAFASTSGSNGALFPFLMNVCGKLTGG